MSDSMGDFVIIGNVSDDPFAIDIGHFCGQRQDVADIISLKSFANTEFCPRFIRDENDLTNIGNGLENTTIVICSTSTHTHHTRDSLAMRTFILARAAKDNGAKKVVLVEPDLFYSAQDRGPRLTRKENLDERGIQDLKKFDGQPISSQLYAQLLKASGVDAVFTIHNHSEKVQRHFTDLFNGEFHNLLPDTIYADYIRFSNFIVTGKDGDNLVLVAPDSGAVPFVNKVYDTLDLPKTKRLTLQKVREGERKVSVSLSPDSEISLEELQGKDVIVLDDMVRTGSTVIECCEMLKRGRPNRVCLGVTHFYSSNECRENLNSHHLDEILTLNTIPSILNRDTQGRLRKKLVVLKVEKWVAKWILGYMGKDASKFEKDFYTVDMSSKNPRWRPSTGVF